MSVKYFNTETNKWVIFPGTVGAPGKDAYTVAQENGYTGSREEYIQTLLDIPVVIDKIIEADEVPTEGSENLVISGGTYQSIENVRNDLNSTLDLTKQDLENKISQVDNKVDKEITDRIQYVQDSIYDGLDYNNPDVKKSLSATQGKILNEKITQLSSPHYKIVDELPEIGETNYIYLVPKESGVIDGYDEHIYINIGTPEEPNYSWEKVGQTDINLEPYELKTDHDNDINNLQAQITTNTENISSNLEKINNITNNGSKITGSLSIRKENSESGFDTLLSNWKGESNEIITIPAYPTKLPNPNKLTITANTEPLEYDGSSVKSINLDSIFTKNLKTTDTPGKPGIYINTSVPSLTITNNLTETDSSGIIIVKGDCIVTLPNNTYAIDEISQISGSAEQIKVFCLQKVSNLTLINCALYNLVN